MGLFFVYILKSSVCLAGFYLFYRLLLSKETFHRFNRMALLGVLLFSCLVPLMEVSVKSPVEIQQSFLSLEEMMFMDEWDGSATVVGDFTPSFPWWALLLVVYLLGILFFLGRHFWSLGKMIRLVKHCRKSVLENGITLFTHDEKKVAPFSWMKFIVVCEEDLKENGDAILAHERAHVQNGHSWDLLLAEVCIFFQWFNPAAWLLKQELQNIHEYEADEWVISQGIDAKRYQLLLIKKAVGARLYSIANSFNHSSLKKRITMMIKKKSNPWARMKYLYVLPLATIAVAAFARSEVSNRLDEISSVKVNDLTSIMKTDEVKSVEKSSDEKFKISGKVLADKTKKPVSGASVIVRGTIKGTLTDSDGKFSLEVKQGDILMFSFMGLRTQSLTVADNAPLTVLLNEDVEIMDELMVVGVASDGVGAPSKTYPDKKVVAVVDVPNEAEVPQDNIFTVVEEMPHFQGGIGKCMKFIAENVNYPVELQKAKVEGRVVVQFIVGKDGSISNATVVRSVHPELDAEALRVISLMPKWVPGKQRGQNVAVKFTIPIAFQLQKSDSEVKTLETADVVDESQIFVHYEDMPAFPGGMRECMKFLAENIKYPVNALKEGIQGRVIVQFVVKTDGTIGDATVVRGIHPELDAEALRVVNTMPKWQPGRTRGQVVEMKYSIPVFFQLQNQESKEEAYRHVNLKVDKEANQANVENVKNHLRTRESENSSLVYAVVVDGKEVGMGAEALQKVMAGTIEHIEVLSAKNAMAKYGEKSKDGAIEIKTRK